MIASLQSSGEAQELRASVEKMMRQAMAERVKQLEVQAAAGNFAPAPPGPVVVQQTVEVPCVTGSVSIEIPVLVHATPPLRHLPPSAFARVFEHLGLVEHSVQFICRGAGAILSAAASHAGSAHRK